MTTFSDPQVPRGASGAGNDGSFAARDHGAPQVSLEQRAPEGWEALRVQGVAMDADHRVISVSGWRCDVCGVEVNGQTDDEGWPMVDGDSVRHTP